MRVILIFISLFSLSGCCVLPAFSNNAATISKSNATSNIAVYKYARGMVHGPISCLCSREYKSTLIIKTNKNSGKIYPGEFSLGENGEQSSEKMQGYIELSNEKLIIDLYYFYSEKETHKENFFNGEYQVIKVKP